MSALGPYNLSFTAASLRPELARIVAEHYLTCGDWQKTKAWVLATNALQCRSSASAVRLEREMRSRLQDLTKGEMELLARSTLDERILVAWLAAVKHSAFLFDFAGELLRGKLDLHEPVLRSSDYDRFIEEKSVAHPELAHLTESSAAKVRRVLLRMLRETGILQKGIIHRPLLSPRVVATIREDKSRWLAAFLVPESEIRHRA